MICVAFFPNSAKSPFYTRSIYLLTCSYLLTRILQEPHRMSYLSPWDCFYSNTIRNFDITTGVNIRSKALYPKFDVISEVIAFYQGGGKFLIKPFEGRKYPGA